jgi:hypothetical protein
MVMGMDNGLRGRTRRSLRRLWKCLDSIEMAMFHVLAVLALSTSPLTSTEGETVQPKEHFLRQIALDSPRRKGSGPEPPPDLLGR